MKSKGQKQNRSPITAIGEHLLSDNRLEELNYRCVPLAVACIGSQN
jgi:hypothetical protein